MARPERVRLLGRTRIKLLRHRRKARTCIQGRERIDSDRRRRRALLSLILHNSSFGLAVDRPTLRLGRWRGMAREHFMNAANMEQWSCSRETPHGDLAGQQRKRDTNPD